MILIFYVVFLGSYEQSPRLLEMHRCHRRDSDSSTGDLQLREDLADAMQESPAPAREQGMFKQPLSLNMYIIRRRATFPIRKLIVTF